MQNSLPLTIEADEAPGPRAELRDVEKTIAFLLAGNAHVTFQSRRSGTRYTYRVRTAEARMVRAGENAGPSHFVSVLTGPDYYEYLGCIYGSRSYSHGRKSRIATNAPSAITFTWVWRKLVSGETHPELAVYHEGRCGRCGRRLTDPTSISQGLGPTCRGRQ